MKEEMLFSVRLTKKIAAAFNQTDMESFTTRMEPRFPYVRNNMDFIAKEVNNRYSSTGETESYHQLANIAVKFQKQVVHLSTSTSHLRYRQILTEIVSCSCLLLKL